MGKSLLKDSAILSIFGAFSMFFAYSYHLIMARMLGPSDYGILSSIVALLFILGVPTATIQTAIARYTAVKGVKVKSTFFYFLRRIAILSIIITALFIIISPLIAGFLNLEDSTPLVILGFSFIIGPLLALQRGLLGGLERFKSAGFNSSIDALLKTIFAFLLVYFGFGVNGAVLAMILAPIVAIILAYTSTKDVYSAEESKTEKEFSYIANVFVMLILLGVLSSIDLILVKHYFSNSETGLYSIGSLFGKIILFSSLAVTGAMFPKTAKEQKILGRAVSYVLLMTLAITLVYALANKFIVNLFFGVSYIEIAGILPLFSIAFGMISIVALLAHYDLSIGKYRLIPYIVIVIIAEIAMIYFNHENLTDILQSVIVSSLIAIIAGLVIFRKEMNIFQA